MSALLIAQMCSLLNEQPKLFIDTSPLGHKDSLMVISSLGRLVKRNTMYVDYWYPVFLFLLVTFFVCGYSERTNFHAPCVMFYRSVYQ